ncbi:tautomerase family protein [Campylobacter sp. 19-13652]|uniref:tautomerase family protein n=1 Tax=Campylobacter sp. 19-13652 TaxID=2840180 RepID=UPI001C75CF38|nr:tautomerase family protein [Campylobacter sp. 19-13652]BCX79154.1 tautomerase [Campylobacter sp. 19-13652]
MPYINIKITKENGTPTQEQKDELARGVVELFEKVMKRSAKNAVVIIDEIAPSDYFISGISVKNLKEKQ